MLAELLYPKELKDIIADLRAKGDLNDVAVKNLNNAFNTSFMRHFFITLVIVGSLFFFYGLWLGIIGILFSVVLAFIDISSDLKFYSRLVILLVKGKRAVGKVLNTETVSPSFVTTGYFIEYKFSCQDQEIKSKEKEIRKKYITRPILKDAEVTVAYDPNAPSRNVLVLSEFEKLFSLKREGNK